MGILLKVTVTVTVTLLSSECLNHPDIYTDLFITLSSIMNFIITSSAMLGGLKKQTLSSGWLLKSILPLEISHFEHPSPPPFIKNCSYINPLHPNINIHIFHTVLYTFTKVLTRRICLTIKSF